MDRKSPLRSQQFPSLSTGPGMTPRERRSHEQFAREYAEQLLRTRAALVECAK